MAVEKKTLIVTVEYTLKVQDEQVARFMADLVLAHGQMMGSENYGIWDWNPDEKVISAEVK